MNTRVIDAFLKLTGSLKMLLVPSDEHYIDKKKFSWTLTDISEDNLTLKVDFENPYFITSNHPDTLLVSISNAKKFLVPKAEDLKSVPD